MTKIGIKVHLDRDPYQRMEIKKNHTHWEYGSLMLWIAGKILFLFTNIVYYGMAVGCFKYVSYGFIKLFYGSFYKLTWI